MSDDPGKGRRDERGAGPGRSGRNDVPRRLSEVLSPALDRMATSDQARAYSAWARAVGSQVAAGSRPKAFSRGRLTVECSSAVWANELTYLGPEILARMTELAPGHPVRSLRFTIGRPAPPSDVAESAEERAPEGVAPAPTGAPAPAPTSPPDPAATPGGPGHRAGADPGAGSPEASRRQGSTPPASKEMAHDGRSATGAYDAARTQAEGVRDERFRAAIEAALRRSSDESPEAPGGATPSG